jgi:hypothetical protein
MPSPILLALVTASSLAIVPAHPAHANLCDGNTAASALEEMLPRARAALDLAGTEQVDLDPSQRCIDIQVRTAGTARLVALLLRGVDIPHGAVDLRVLEPLPVRWGS